jgi:phage baseplate assembly protein W
MPIPQILRIDPRDLNKNRAIGVSLPFNGGGVFRSTFSTKDQIKSNLINLLLTYKGERILNPEFGADLPRILFDPIDDNISQKIQSQIISSTQLYIPEITIDNIEVNPDIDKNTIFVIIAYTINLSGTKDKIIIDFSTLQ